ncbi:MAG: hypothetical protein NTY61_00870 [Candidatus Parcubacteria bacterium]|nr:hypothetical protein [Candidatus Parcubacteria bacterium]
MDPRPRQIVCSECGKEFTDAATFETHSCSEKIKLVVIRLPSSPPQPPRRFKDIPLEEQNAILDQLTRNMSPDYVLRLAEEYQTDGADLGVIYTVSIHMLGLPPEDPKKQAAYRYRFGKLAKKLTKRLID